MASLNKVHIIGRLGKDPELAYTNDGTAVCRLSVATSESWKDKATGEKKELTEWHRITFWRRLAEICNEYLRKGSLIYVEGKLQTRSYEKDGDKRYSTDIIAQSMQMLDTRGAGQTASRDYYGDPPPERAPAATAPPEDDIPF
jgi:single-strand DNA-binding protein